MSVADKLRALCDGAGKAANDGDEDDDMLGDGTTAKAKTSLAVEPMPASKKLRLRADIPMPIPGKKINRKDLETDPSPLPDDDQENEPPARKSDSAANFALRQDIEQECAALGDRTPLVMVAPQKSALSSTCSGPQLQRQIDVFRRLLAVRIQLEQPVKAAHCLPQQAVTEHAAELEKMQGQAWELLDTLLRLQGRARGPAAARLELPAVSASRKRMRDETWAELEQRNEAIFSWALDIFDDVKEKTKLEARKGFKVLDQSLSAQLNATLSSDSEWRRKCHPRVGANEVIGGSISSKDALYDPMIYDDRDFYASMLKDIIQHGGTQDGEKFAMSKRQAQKLKVRDAERRASKGRKIRYVTIEKLQNFMAPIVRPQKDPETVDQLMKSLFK